MIGIDELRTLYYFASGQPISQIKTDAGWSRPGTHVLGGHHNVGRWSYLPYRRRAAITWGALAMLLAIATSVIVAPAVALAAARLIGWCYLLPSLLWVWWDFERRRQHRRDVLAPLGVALATRLNDARYQLNPQQWIDTPVDPLDRATRVYLPIGYDPSPSNEQTLTRLIARRIGLVAPHATFYLQGEAPYVELTPAPAPRDVVNFSQADVQAAIENAPEGQYLLGFGPRDEPVYVDFEAESPHIALSVATGGGKSIAARALAMQVLHEGGIVLVLDRKIESQIWARKHPGVRYACTEDEIATALMEVSGEINRRFRLVHDAAFSEDDHDRPDVGPRLMVICEELNALEIDLRIWWRSIRESGDPAQCPALAVLGRILAMGRAARTHMIVIAQKLTCQAIGGTAARENLSTRILGRATTSTWNMLAPECKTGGRFPKGSRHRGRMHVVVGDEARLTQVMYASDKEALDYSLDGVTRAFPDLVADVESAFGGEGGTGGALALPGRMTGGEVPHRLTGLPGGAADDDQIALLDETGIPVEDEGDLLSIAQYVSELIEREGGDRKGLTKALSNARDRAVIEPRVKPGRGKPSLFHRDDLDDWMGRRRAGVGGDAL